MPITRSITRNQHHDDDDDDDDDDASSSSKTIKTDDVGPWSYLNHDLLFLVMMQLGVIDFLAFSGVCKSWRSVALSNWKRFMASQPPMLMHISPHYYKEKDCYLEDYKRRKFKFTLTHSAGIDCLGSTSGYLILLRYKTNDFWLVNLITKHELIFPPVPCDTNVSDTTCVLFFSPSISRLVFVILANKKIWFSIVGEGSWNRVSSTFDFTFKDLHVFKGKIYNFNPHTGHLCELTIDTEAKVTLLETKKFLEDPYIYSLQLVSSGENLYVMVWVPFQNTGDKHAYKLNFGKMEWVPFQNTGDKHAFAFFFSDYGHGAAVKAELWADHWSWRYSVTNGSGVQGMFILANEWWYYPHECLNVNLLDES